MIRKDTLRCEGNDRRVLPRVRHFHPVTCHTGRSFVRLLFFILGHVIKLHNA
ncbi:hypothetical protein SAMN06265218_11041 [Fodinibius sediminis]|uniref:Uncharacterized protein n=1 Tax=Fodinibius sediminis TaxID=1214077 RepID=A0A521DHF2_9BACT|nr:hypothetical protein SAMN06265218_11041 [Fodinibius sediminis]